jgi:hypothetical protein
MTANHGAGKQKPGLERGNRRKSLPTPSQSICAGDFSLRAAKIRSVRPFSRSCGENSIRAGHASFRAGQLSVRAGKNPSVRPFFDLCGQKPIF